MPQSTPESRRDAAVGLQERSAIEYRAAQWEMEHGSVSRALDMQAWAKQLAYAARACMGMEG